MSTLPAAEFGGTDRFRVIRRIGTGGMGSVYEVHDHAREERVALKAIRNPDAELLYRLKNEFRALADLKHKHLVGLHELFVEGNTCFFTMELVEGTELSSYLRAEAGDETVPPGALACDEARLRAVLPQLVEGLDALHRAGKIHRDIKPSNVLVTPDGRLVLVDFGLVMHTQDAEPVTQSGQPIGTAAYMAPEQALGEARLTPAVDWYAVGVVIYEALTGRLPFSGPTMEMLADKQTRDPEPPRARVPRAPRDLDALAMELLSRDPSARPGGDVVRQRLGLTPDVPAPLSAPAAPRQVQIAGRERELAQLERGLAAVKDGRAAVALVCGPSGIGKSTLVHAFLERARRETANLVVLEGRCYEREVISYKAMDSVVDRLSHLWMTLPTLEAQALAPREAALLPRLFPVLGRVPAVIDAPSGRAISDPQELRTRAFSALREVLQRLGDRRRLVVVLDDLQWVDANTRMLLADLMRPPDAPALLLVLSSRVEGSEALEALAGQMDAARERIDLAPLTEEAAIALSRQHLGAAQGELAERVAREAAGNPFFIAELAQHVQTHRIGADLGEVRLDELVGRRIGELPEDARRLLEVVVLAGEPITLRCAGAAAALSGGALVGAAEVLRGLRLLRVSGGRSDDRVEPYHDRIRDAAAARLEPSVRRDHHRALAIAYEAWSEASADLLARHWQGAGDHARAAAHARKAGDDAFRALDFDRAAVLYGLSLELGTHDPSDEHTLRTAFAEALSNAGRLRDSAEQFMLATRGATPEVGLELRRRSAEALLRGGYLAEGLAALRAVLGEIGLGLARTPLSGLLGLLIRRAWVRLRGLGWKPAAPTRRQDFTRVDICWSAAAALGVADHIRGADFQARHLILALGSGDARRIQRAFFAEACFLGAQGAVGRAREAVDQANALARTLNEPYALALAKWSSAFVGYFCDSAWRTSREGFSEAEALLRGHCQTGGWELDTVQLYDLFARMYLGDLVELDRLVAGYRREAERRGDRYMAVNVRARLALVGLVRDDPAGASTDVEEAIGSWAPQSDAFQVQHFWALFSRCEISLYQGQAARAAAQMAADLGALRRSLLLRLPLVSVEILHLRARIALAVGAAAGGKRRAQAAEALALSRKLAALPLPLARATVPLVEAGAAMLLDDRPRATARLQAAERELEALGMALHAAATRRRLGEFAGGERGADLVAAADAWMTAQGVRNPTRLVGMLLPGW